MTIRNKFSKPYRPNLENVVVRYDEGKKDSLLVKAGETLLVILISLFIASVIGSMIWGNEGFVYLLASFF